MLNGNGNGNDSGDNAETGNFTAILRQVEQPTAVATTGSTAILVSPVPTADMLQISNIPAEALVAVYNSEGKMVMHQRPATTTAQYSLKELPAGTYYVVISAASGRFTQSIIKQ